MRGNRSPAPEHSGKGGSIPAYAGEPVRVTLATVWPGVYPRVCGGTRWAKRRLGTGWGLSPRMRGNRTGAGQDCYGARSIPAYAGEPGALPLQRGRLQVYPRVCGGTRLRVIQCAAAMGLSPRMRGNRGAATRCAGSWRSIPAYAGEPGMTYSKLTAVPVYPRVCGGTHSTAGAFPNPDGLSPRMRGNP